MTPRRALFWIGLALLLAGLFVGATWLLGRLARTPARPPAVPLLNSDAFAMPLDANGMGAQTINGTQFVIQVEPYPAQAHAPVSITLVALNLDTGETRTVTPTLALTPPNTQNSAEVRRIAFQRDVRGVYFAHGIALDQAGVWRVRIDNDMGAQDVFTILLNLQAPASSATTP